MCKSWVWKADSHECSLKKVYEAEESRIPCDSCVAYAPEGSYFFKKVDGTKDLVSRKRESPPAHKDLSWAGPEGGIFMPMTVAERLCAVERGYDQPAEFDILDQPLIVQFSFMCCNECAKRDGNRLSLAPILCRIIRCVIECMSWVFKKATNECFLKDTYDESRKEPGCEDCLGFSKTSEIYTFQKPSTKVYRKTIFTSTTPETKWTTERYGDESRWKRTTEADVCTYTEGYNQPKAYDLLPKPLILDDGGKCCAACNRNPRSISLPFDTALLKECVLQNASRGSGEQTCTRVI